MAIFHVVVEESISFDNGVTVGTTGNFQHIKQPELTGPTFANAKVTFHTKETWSPYNPYCNDGNGGGPAPAGMNSCKDVETYSGRSSFDYEKINGDWFLLSTGGPDVQAYPSGTIDIAPVDIPVYINVPPPYPLGH